MTVRIRTLFGDAWAAWRRDRAVIGPLAGLFQFVPQWALLLLIPPAPEAPAEGGADATAAFTDAFAAWLGAHGWWFLIGLVLSTFAILATIAVAVDRDARTAGGALARAALMLPRYFLATLLVVFPASLLAAPALVLPGGPLLLGLLLVWLLARAILIGPVILAERPVGAVRAIAASWRRTRGNGLVLAAALALVIVAGQVVASIVQGIAAPLAVSQIAVAVATGVAALAMTASSVASALLAAAAYRRLPPRQGI